ncbi:hypothetical protein HaLaN_05909 [Haematococcus lacustris]|uniref:Uncharacterized protein n=1 Tax=Haematococcus lacustris TaxID=44745 RepID=A0A699YUU8_HAELA|nr:hypothetical protein HaLaN_05909 [Haematococcus lacustris]
MDGDLMRPPSRPPRLDGVAESLRCRRKGNASAPSPPHRVQPVNKRMTTSSMQSWVQPRPADWIPPAGQVNHRLLSMQVVAAIVQLSEAIPN